MLIQIRVRGGGNAGVGLEIVQHVSNQAVDVPKLSTGQTFHADIPVSSPRKPFHHPALATSPRVPIRANCEAIYLSYIDRICHLGRGEHAWNTLRRLLFSAGTGPFCPKRSFGRLGRVDTRAQDHGKSSRRKHGNPEKIQTWKCGTRMELLQAWTEKSGSSFSLLKIIMNITPKTWSVKIHRSQTRYHETMAHV